MSSVDNRIVKMQMDNGQFTNAANATMNTLKKLGESLKLTEGAKGLENIASKAKNVNMDSLAAGVETVKAKFSALDIVGVTALVNIANSAINAGKNLVKSLTLDPVMDGFREYETKMGAIQTILTNTMSKGTTMDEVNKALGELNEYSDKTIYNFAQMTDNIGKATAAGVGLEDSVTFVKGLANVAAGFGVDATRMAGATYQMTQALSAGVIKLQDWKSLEQSGMGGQMLQDELINTAKEMGVFVDTSIPFRETLESNWLSSDVFIKTMDKMAKNESLVAAAQNVTSFTKLIDTMKETVGSGWAVSWENIFGNKDQSTALFTSISNNFSTISGAMADYRNEALKFWNEQGGRDATLNGMKNVLQVIGKILGPIYESFKKIVDPWNGAKLVEISKGFEEWSNKLKISDKTMVNITKTFDGIFSLFSIFKQIIGGVVIGIIGLIPLLAPIADGFLNITGSIGEFIVKMKDAFTASGVLKSIMGVIINTISTISTAIGSLLSNVGDWISELSSIDLSGIAEFSNKMIECFTPIESMGLFIKTVIDSIKNAFISFMPIAIKFATIVWDTLTKISEAIMNTLGGRGNGIINILNAGLIGAIILGVKKLIDVFKDLTGNVTGIIESVTEIFDGVKGSIEEFQNNLKAERLITIASAIGILAASLFVISTIDSAKLISALTSMGVMFGELVGAMAILDKIGGGAKIGASMIILSTSLLILSKALVTVSDIPWQKSIVGLGNIAVMMGLLIATSKLMEKESKGMIKSSIALNIFTKAIDNLSQTVILLSGMNLEQMGKGLLGIAALMTELVLFMKLSDISGMSVSKTIGILIFAEALVILSKVAYNLSTINSSSLIKSLGAMAILMTEIVLFTKLIGNPKGLISTSIGISILAGGLLILTDVISKMGSLNPTSIGNGLMTLASSLTIIAVAVRLMPKNLIVTAVSLTVLSGALLVISNVLTTFGNMSWSTIAKGLTMLGLSLVILAAGSKLMAGGLLGAAALTVMAGALALLTPSLVILGSMSLANIGKSLIILAGAFVVIGVAGLVLSPLTPILLGLGAAMALFGVACLAIGVGISAFATGLTILAAAGSAGAAALTLAITTIAGLIPMILISVANGLLGLIKVFIDNTAIISEALLTLFTVVIQSLTNAIPPLIELVNVLLIGLLDLIINITPKIVEALMTIIMSVLETLGKNIPIIAGLVVESLVTLIVTVLNELANSIPKIATAITNIIVAILNAIGTNVPRLVNAAYDMIISMINGLADAVEVKMPQVRAAVKRLVTAIITEFKSAISDAVNVGGNIIDGLKRGISNGIESVKQAAKNVASSALSAAKNFLGIHSPSREFEALGKYSDQGLANGLSKYSTVVESEAIGVADGALSGMRKAMDAVTDIINGDMDNQPVIRPVMDLSDIQNGAGQIGSLVNGNYSIQTSVNAANRVSNDMLSRATISDGFGQSESVTSNNTNTITNTFNITGENPRAIAEEVSKILQKQVERRNGLWA